jgi:hypothetical protein
MVIAASRSRPVRRLGVASVIAAFLAILVVAGGLYYWAGWNRMAQTCEPHGESRSVSYSWSWSAPGFSCESADGYRQSKLWW